jgi:HAD superfamily hydrolase (TIGR01662 family)
LKRNAPLVNILKRLSRDYRLAVVTNNNRVQTERVLEAVGIRRFFSVIQSFTDSSCLKPDPKVFAQVARRLRVKPRECLSVGDRVDTDLIPAAKSGMRVFHVASPRGINRLVRSKTLLA